MPLLLILFSQRHHHLHSKQHLYFDSNSFKFLKMKNYSPGLLKKVLSVFMAAKGRASAVRTRFIIFRLLHDKTALLSSVSRKISQLSCEEENAVTLQDGADGEPSDGVCEGDDSVRCDAESVGNLSENDAELDPEDGIDEAAGVFIRRFHRQMMIQKQESFKMYQEMLARGA